MPETRRGSKPGEHRGGRKPGTPNKATKEWRELFDEIDGPDREKTRAILERLFEVATDSGPRGDWRAGEALLDRRFGRPKQSVEPGGDASPIQIVISESESRI